MCSTILRQRPNALSAMSAAALFWLAASAAAAGALQVGDAAPDFELEASDGNTYALRDFRGKQTVVLAWFPKAYTRGCTIECKSLAENGHLIRRYDVSYFMASVDPMEDNKGFAEQQNAGTGAEERCEADRQQARPNASRHAASDDPVVAAEYWG